MSKTTPPFNFEQVSGISRQFVSQLPTKLSLKFLRSWGFWAVVTFSVSGGLGFLAVGTLFNPKGMPNCPEMFLPMASASMRLYCGQLAAAKQTLPDLLTALNLVKDIPQDHPLSNQINKNIETWSLDILRLANESFQDGKLDEAINTAKQIPSHVPAYKLVADRVQRWQTTWRKAEEIYQTSQELLRNTKPVEAYREAVKLTRLDCRYWATTKYEELASGVQQAKEDSAKLDQAYRLIKSNDIKDLTNAIAIAKKINAQSYAYKEAQTIISKAANQMLALAQAQLAKNNWQGVLDITKQIPAVVELQSTVDDLTAIAQAQSIAKEGTIADLEKAITLIQGVKSDSNFYTQAQGMLTRWQIEIQDVALLQRARNFAATGTVPDLQNAINEAGKIPANNPRAQESAQLISQWRKDIEIVQDRPYLEAAERLAVVGDLASLQEAIAQLRPITSGRALYSQAQEKTRKWTEQIQTIQDQPIVDTAQAQAQSGNLAQAIATASQISSGRPLYGKAQSLIRDWRGELEADQILIGAQKLANQGTPEALLGAIDGLNRIPKRSRVYEQSRAVLNNLSNQLLQSAQSVAPTDLQRAIAIAQSIPSNTSAYGNAQQLINQWENELNNSINSIGN